MNPHEQGLQVQPNGDQVSRDATVVAVALSVVILVAALFEGNVALVALPLVAVLAAAALAGPWSRRLAVGIAIAFLGAYLGIVSHWLFYDNGAPTDHWSVSRLVVRGLAAVVVAAAALAFSHARQTVTRR